ncbi:unnamed protein product [Closterium sp. NIES-64]|nr:unnamed protein product [Closterium sp. NIES-64]
MVYWACMGRAAGGGRVHMGMEREDKAVFTVPGVPSPIYPIFCVAHCRETLVGGGGRVHMGMEGEDKVVYEEQPGEVVTAMTHAPFLYNITHCSPPIHGQVCPFLHHKATQPPSPAPPTRQPSPHLPPPQQGNPAPISRPPNKATQPPSPAPPTRQPSPHLPPPQQGNPAPISRPPNKATQPPISRPPNKATQPPSPAPPTRQALPSTPCSSTTSRTALPSFIESACSESVFESTQKQALPSTPCSSTTSRTALPPFIVISYRIYQWMDLHIRMGVDHFSLNDVGGVDPQLRTLIAPLLDEGIVEITDFRDLLNYEVWYDGQVMMVNDCVYRFRHLSKWIMYLDFDEFMFINAIPRLSARIHRLTHAQSCFPLLVSPFSCPPSDVPLSPLMHPSFMWLFGNTTPLSAHTLPSSCPEFIPPSHVPLSPLTTFLLRDVALPGAHAHASLSAFTTSSCLARAFPMRACPLRPYEGNTL